MDLAIEFFEYSRRRAQRMVPIEQRLDAAMEHINALPRAEINMDVIKQIAQSCRVGMLAVIALIK